MDAFSPDSNDQSLVANSDSKVSIEIGSRLDIDQDLAPAVGTLPTSDMQPGKLAPRHSTK